MALLVTPRALVAAHEYLTAVPPISRWRLPHADEIEFHVVAGKPWLGLCEFDPRTRRAWIKIDASQIGSTMMLLAVVAHEIVHLRQFVRGHSRSDAHDAEFRRLARTVAKVHGFDPHWIQR